MNGKSEKRALRCEVYFSNGDTVLANLKLKSCRKVLLCEAVEVGCSFAVKTLEGQMTGQPGDYLMKGPKGEFYVCRADIFKETYEFVEGAKTKRVSKSVERRLKIQSKPATKAAS